MSEMVLEKVAYLLINHVKEQNGECYFSMRFVGDDAEEEVCRVYSGRRSRYPDLDIRSETGEQVGKWVQGVFIPAPGGKA